MQMVTAKFQFFFFITLTILSLILLFFILQPYFTPVFLAIILAIAFHPMHKTLLGYFKAKNLTSLVSTLIVLVVIITPLLIFSLLIFEEAQRIVQGDFGLPTVREMISGFEDKLTEFIPGITVDIKQYLEIEVWFSQIISNVVEYFNAVFAGFIRFGLGAFLMVLALFYLFRDGTEFLRKTGELSLLKKDHTKIIFSKIEQAVNAVVRGRLLVGLIQGFVIGVGFFIFGVPGPVLWGVIAAIASMLPIVGPMFIIIPTALILFFAGALWPAVGILLWGIIAVIVVDEYLGSVLIDQRMKIHPFLILLSVLGGISFFGPIGFIVGPVVLASVFALLEIYSVIFNGSEARQ